MPKAKEPDKAPDVVVEPVDTLTPLHLDAYEARFGYVPSDVRPGMFSLHGTEMHSKTEWDQMFKAELTRRII